MIIITLATPRFRHERCEDGVDRAAAAGGAEEDDDDHDDELGDPAAAFVAELVGEDAELRFDGFAFGVECDALLFQLGKDASQAIFLPHPLYPNVRIEINKRRKKHTSCCHLPRSSSSHSPFHSSHPTSTRLSIDRMTLACSSI